MARSRRVSHSRSSLSHRGMSLARTSAAQHPYPTGGLIAHPLPSQQQQQQALLRVTSGGSGSRKQSQAGVAAGNTDLLLSSGGSMSASKLPAPQVPTHTERSSVCTGPPPPHLADRASTFAGASLTERLSVYSGALGDGVGGNPQVAVLDEDGKLLLMQVGGCWSGPARVCIWWGCGVRVSCGVLRPGDAAQLR